MRLRWAELRWVSCRLVPTHRPLAVFHLLQGILTPFDRLDGFERRIERGPWQQQPAPPSAAAAGEAGDAAGGTSQQHAAAAAAGGPQTQQHDSIRRVGEAVRAARAARPTSILMDMADLPRRDRPGRCVARSLGCRQRNRLGVPNSSCVVLKGG